VSTCVWMGLIHRLVVQSGLFRNPKMAIYGECLDQQVLPALITFKCGMEVKAGTMMAGKMLMSCNSINYRTYNLESFLCY
jgi:hypothetical protein